MGDGQPSDGTGRVEWEAVCHEEGCRGIDRGSYTTRRYAASDKDAHERWHEQRGEAADVEVVKRSVGSRGGR